MKLTPVRFLQSYNALGVRFKIQGGVVVSTGASPAFCEWCIAHSEWIKPGLPVQCRDYPPVQNSTPNVESTHADRLIWQGITNAKRNAAKVEAVKGGRYR